MQPVNTMTDEHVRNHESIRLAALYSTGILDTLPEPAYDSITRLAAEYFHAGSAVIAFADQTRVWIKSFWGDSPLELPRAQSIFDTVLANNGPVVIDDLLQHAHLAGQRRNFKFLKVDSLASVPIRCVEGNILGTLNIFLQGKHPAMTLAEIGTLESMADMVASQLELRI